MPLVKGSIRGHQGSESIGTSFIAFYCSFRQELFHSHQNFLQSVNKQAGHLYTGFHHTMKGRKGRKWYLENGRKMEKAVLFKDKQNKKHIHIANKKDLEDLFISSKTIHFDSMKSKIFGTWLTKLSNAKRQLSKLLQCM